MKWNNVLTEILCMMKKNFFAEESIYYNYYEHAQNIRRGHMSLYK